jgi:FixJ family two-component response regulator
MVYLIEDDKYVRRAFELLLTSAGYEYQSYDSADTFLLHYSSGLKDVIILDLNLPGIHGCELITNLKDKNISVPIIVVTAASELVFKEQCIRNGVKAFMKKPVDSEALLDIIHSTLENTT